MTAVKVARSARAARSAQCGLAASARAARPTADGRHCRIEPRAQCALSRAARARAPHVKQHVQTLVDREERQAQPVVQLVELFGASRVRRVHLRSRAGGARADEPGACALGGQRAPRGHRARCSHGRVARRARARALTSTSSPSDSCHRLGAAMRASVPLIVLLRFASAACSRNRSMVCSSFCSRCSSCARAAERSASSRPVAGSLIFALSESRHASSSLNNVSKSSYLPARAARGRRERGCTNERESGWPQATGVARATRARAARARPRGARPRDARTCVGSSVARPRVGGAPLLRRGARRPPRAARPRGARRGQ